MYLFHSGPLLCFQDLSVITLCARVVRNPALLLTFVGADQVVSEHEKTTDASNANRGRVGTLVRYCGFIENKEMEKLGLSS